MGKRQSRILRFGTCFYWECSMLNIALKYLAAVLAASIFLSLTAWAAITALEPRVPNSALPVPAHT
jgi:hypothetical protein